MRHWIHRLFRRSRRAPQPLDRRRRPYVEDLEDRCLLAAPVIDPLQVPLNVPVGKTLVVPVTGTDPAGGTVSYSVTSNSPNVTVQQLTGNTFLQLTVQNFGTMEFELFNDMTPMAASLIGGMAKSGFYNGLQFQRVINGFVIQGGDPTVAGRTDPNLHFTDEFQPNLIYSGNGQLGMANSGPDTNDTQFFITDGAQRSLDFNQEVFGQLVRGFSVLKAIEQTPVNNPTSQSPSPITPVVITSAQIIQDPNAAVFLLKSTGTSTTSTSLSITATASTGGSSSETLPLNVVTDTQVDPPILGPVTDQVSPTGTPVSFTLTRTDLQNNASTFEAIANPNVTNNNFSNVTVTVTPAADNASAVVTVTPKTVSGSAFTGPVSLLVGVSQTGATSRGSGGTNLFDTQAITVSFGDQPLTFTAAQTVSAVEGAAATTLNLGTLVDADTTAVAGDFTATVNWGDGSPLASTAQFSAVSGSPGHFILNGTHSYKEAGTFSISVKITDVHTSTAGGDNGGATASGSTTAAVTDAPLTAHGNPITAAVGTTVSNALLATLTDSNPNATPSDYSVSINWGDGTAPSSGTVQVGAAGQLQVFGSHTFAAQGTFAPVVTVTDVNTAGDATPATATTALTATVAGPSLTTNQQYVEYLFQILVGQAPTSDQLTKFSGELGAGTSRLQVVQQIQALPQYNPYYVKLMYQTLLGTSPTSKEMNDALNALKKGDTLGTLRVQLLASDTYFTTKGGGTNTGFLNSLGKLVLNQAMPAALQTRLTQELSSGASRLSVIQDFVRADRKAVKTAETQDLYHDYLGRAATSAEMSSTIKMNIGADEKSIAASLLARDEAFNAAQHPVAATATTVKASPTSAVSGQPVTLTAVVSPAPTGGMVLFTDQTTGATLGTAIPNSSGQATLTTTTLASGSHTLAAQYEGSSGFGASFGTTAVTVGVASTSMALNTSGSPSVFGQAVTFTATISPVAPGAGTPTGVVTFTDTTTGTTLGTGTLNSAGQATVTTSALSVASHTITASYPGDSNFGPISNTVSQVVNKANVTVIVTSSGSPSTSGSQVTFKAAVAAVPPGAGTPTGTVTIVDQTTSTTLGSGTLDSSGQFSVNATLTTTGTHNIVATYAGDGNFNGNTGSVSQQVM
jgi:cyclophilin family peptidyl-prolyl cis-trans isomerase